MKYEKLLILAVLAFAVVMTGTAYAEDVWFLWYGDAGNSLWTNPWNWDLMSVPQANQTPPNDARIERVLAPITGPVIQTGDVVGTGALDLGVWLPGLPYAELTMTGGTFTISGWWALGDKAGAYGKMTVTNGTILATAGPLTVGMTGVGLLIVGDPCYTGNPSIRVNGSGIVVGRDNSASGTIQLYNGTLRGQSLSMIGAPGSTSLLNIEKGTLNVSNNVVTTLINYIAQNRIQSYLGRGGFTLGYNSTTRLTTLTATEPNWAIAWNPIPRYTEGYYVEGAAAPDANLTWSAGLYASSHNVYLGTSLAEVNNAADPNVYPGRGNTTATSFNGNLAFSQTYYWRIDEVNDFTSQVWKGKVWSFTVKANAWTIEYSGNQQDVNNYITVKGVKAYLKDIDPKTMDMSYWQSIFHPKAYIVDNNGHTDLVNPVPGYINHIIYTPILIDRGTYWSLWYGGWDENNELWGWPNRGPADKIYSTIINDYTLTDWSVGTRYTNVMSGYYASPSIPALYHTNDPTIVEVNDDIWYLYCEMEIMVKLDDSNNLPDDPRNWTYAQPGEYGVPCHVIVRLTSTDGGWNYKNSVDEFGLAKKEDCVYISGLKGADYVYYQIAWPTVVKVSDNDYRMYFNAQPDSDANMTTQMVKQALSWEYWNNGFKVDRPGPAIQHDWEGNVLYATSTDGINWTYQGEVKDEFNHAVWAWNPDVKKVSGRDQFVICYNGDTYENGSTNQLPASEGGKWAIAMGYINQSDPLTINWISPEAEYWWDIYNVVFYPPIFDTYYGDVTPQWITEADGDIIGIAHSEWLVNNGINGWLAAAFLQKQVRIVDANNNVIADYQTSANHDELQLSHWALWYFASPWITFEGNQYSHNSPIWGKIQVFDIDGSFMCETGYRWIYPGDVYITQPLIADLNGDGRVDFEDMFILADDWLKQVQVDPLRTDLNKDGHVDFQDFSIFAGDWLKGAD